MRKFALMFLVLIGLTSCAYTEEIVFNNDGSGKYNVKMDGSSFMAMAGDQALASGLGENQLKDIDTTLVFKQLLKEHQDSISKLSAEKQKEWQKLENLVIQMKLKTAQKQFLVSLDNNFKNITDLQDVTKMLHSLQNLEGKEGQQAQEFTKMIENNAEVSYNYSPKKFTRTTKVLAKDKKEDESDSPDMTKMLFQSSSYVMRYSFPKKIKKVSNAEALFSEDKKTVTLKYPFTDYMENPKKLDLVVEFE